MTGALTTTRRPPLAVWLMSLYIVALLSVPVDIGFNVGGAVLTPARLVLLIAVGLALIEWRSQRTAVTGVSRAVWVGWAAFLGAALITAIVWPSAPAWARYASLVGEGLVVFVLVCRAAATPGALRALVAVFAVTTVAIAGAVLLLAVLGIRYDHVLSDLAGTAPVRDAAPRYGFERQPGPFRAPLYFAIWLTAASGLLLPALAEGSARIRRLAVAAWLVLLAAVVVLTTSRLAMTTMFLIPGAYFLIRRPRLIGVACVIAAGVVAVSVSVAPASPVIGESTTLRLSAIDAALQAIRARPLFGWGLLNDSTVLSGIIGKPNFVDNTYLSFAVETGLVGLAGFVLLAASILGATRRGWTSSMGLALAIAAAAVLGMGALASVFQVTQGYAAFFVLAALAVVAATSATRSARSSDPPVATASVVA